MFQKVISKLEALFYNAKIKRLQNEVDYYRNVNTKEATDRLCIILRKFLKYYRCKAIKSLDFRNCNLENCNLEKIHLRRICFWNTNLKNSLLNDAKFSEVDFWKADISNSDVSNTDFTNSIMTYANLENSVLRGSNLKNVRLNEANLYNADFSGSCLKWAKLELFQLKTVRSLENAIMPDGTEYSKEWASIISRQIVPIEFIALWK